MVNRTLLGTATCYTAVKMSHTPEPCRAVPPPRFSCSASASALFVSEMVRVKSDFMTSRAPGVRGRRPDEPCLEEQGRPDPGTPRTSEGERSLPTHRSEIQNGDTRVSHAHHRFAPLPPLLPPLLTYIGVTKVLTHSAPKLAKSTECIGLIYSAGRGVNQSAIKHRRSKLVHRDKHILNTY